MLGRFGYSLDSYQTASFLLVSIPTCPSALLLGRAFRILWLYQLHTDFCLPKKKKYSGYLQLCHTSLSKQGAHWRLKRDRWRLLGKWWGGEEGVLLCMDVPKPEQFLLCLIPWQQTWHSRVYMQLPQAPKLLVDTVFSLTGQITQYKLCSLLESNLTPPIISNFKNSCPELSENMQK